MLNHSLLHHISITSAYKHLHTQHIIHCPKGPLHMLKARGFPATPFLHLISFVSFRHFNFVHRFIPHLRHPPIVKRVSQRVTHQFSMKNPLHRRNRSSSSPSPPLPPLPNDLSSLIRKIIFPAGSPSPPPRVPLIRVGLD